MSQVRRDRSSSPAPTSLLKQCHSRAHGTGLLPDVLGIAPGRETIHPPWVICSVLRYLHNEEILFHVQVEPLIQVSAHSLLSYYLATSSFLCLSATSNRACN